MCVITALVPLNAPNTLWPKTSHRGQYSLILCALEWNTREYGTIHPRGRLPRGRIYSVVIGRDPSSSFFEHVEPCQVLSPPCRDVTVSSLDSFISRRAVFSSGATSSVDGKTTHAIVLRNRIIIVSQQHVASTSLRYRTREALRRICGMVRLTNGKNGTTENKLLVQ